MKIHRFLAAVVVCVALFAAAADTANDATLSKQDREFAIKYLKETEKDFLKSVKGLSDEQWKFKPAPDKWSVAEVSEHITLAEDFLPKMISDQIMKSPEASAEKRAAVKGKEEQILKMIPDRSQKAQAPEQLKPHNTFASRDELLKAFKSKREANIKYIKDTQDPLHAHIAPSPIGEFDAYQWMIFMAAHSKRHTAQIEEVKADANFPKK
jgi:DinB superfamily